MNAPASKAIAADDGIFTTRDSLSCGPLPPLADLARWTEGRLSFWQQACGYDPNDEDRDFLGDTSELRGATRLVLWLGTSLDCQLTLAWVPALLKAAGAAPEQVDVIQFERNERGMELLDLGMLNPDKLAAHPPATTLSRADLDELERTWEAIVSPDPRELESALRSDHPRLPYFKRALRALFRRYPEKASGVNALELRILHWARLANTKAARILGEVLGEIFDAASKGVGGLDVCGDAWLFWRMLRLGDPSLPEPALEIFGSRTQYRHTTVRLTSFGERVLEGRANFVDRNGIDDWVAGVHLSSRAGRVWFYDGGRLVPTS